MTMSNDTEIAGLKEPDAEDVPGEMDVEQGDGVMPPLFNVRESGVCSRLGLNKDELRAIRRSALTEGADWIQHKKRICYSQAGVEKVAAVVGGQASTLEQKAAGSAIAQEIAAIKEPVLVEVLVLRQTRHKQILEGYFPDTDPNDIAKRIRIRVRDGRNFTKGMAVRVEHLGADLYQLVGRCPRSKGRW